VYGPENCAALAKLQGPLQKVADVDGGYNGEFFSISGENPFAARLVPATTTLRSDLLWLELADEPDDALIWDQVYHAVAESTPPPRPIASRHGNTSRSPRVRQQSGWPPILPARITYS